MEMTILGSKVVLEKHDCSIYDLVFYRENPRVYACTHAVPGFTDLTQDEQQEVIFTEIKKQESFRNLLPRIRRHGGLMEPILVRWDTREVVEGNSRLAVYRHLANEDPDGEWDSIACNIATKLTPEQMVAFLSEVHVKGKTTWSAYEKANFAYVRKQAGWSAEKIAKHFGESVPTIYQRIRVVQRMKDNCDSNLQHFSFYHVMETNQKIKQAMNDNPGLANALYSQIRHFGSQEESNPFKAQDLRDKLPKVIDKPKVLKAFVGGNLDLSEAHERAQISKVEQTIRKAKDLLEDVARADVRSLDTPRYNALKQDIRNLTKEVDRVKRMVEEWKPS